MLFRRRDDESKESRRASRKKSELVPYRLASYEHDHEGKRFRSTKVVYSFWSASKYVLVLSLVLWWLPMFGQMIAGYVGGRRAGGPWKGVAAAILPVVCLYAVIEGFENGTLPSQVFGVTIAPAALAASLSSSVPLISPYLHFSSEYVGSFVKMLEGSSPYGINVYVLTVAFAYVGGLLAEQNRREIEYASGSVVSNTTILVQDSASADREMAQAGPRPSGIMGILSGISSAFHRHPDEIPPVTAGVTHARSRGRRRRDPWAGAVEVRYADDSTELDRSALAPGMPMDYPDDYGAYAYSRRGREGDSWNGRPHKRRGRPNMASKPRFRYRQYEEGQSFDAPSYTGAWRRPKRSQKYLTVSSDPRSIKRANKMIEREWRAGSSGRRSFAVAAETLDESDGEAVGVHHQKREHSSHNWDTI